MVNFFEEASSCCYFFYFATLYNSVNSQYFEHATSTTVIWSILLHHKINSRKLCLRKRRREKYTYFILKPFYCATPVNQESQFHNLTVYTVSCSIVQLSQRIQNQAMSEKFLQEAIARIMSWPRYRSSQLVEDLLAHHKFVACLISSEKMSLGFFWLQV